jgi:hypothetical protein
MTGRTLFLLAFSAVLALAACQTSETASSAPDVPAPDMSGWRLSSGKAPTKAEFAALAATCEAQGGAMDPCLTELGLKKAQ